MPVGSTSGSGTPASSEPWTGEAAGVHAGRDRKKSGVNGSRRPGVGAWASRMPQQGSRRWGAPHTGTHPQAPRGPESCTRGRQGGAFQRQRVRSQQLPPRATQPSHEDSGPGPASGQRDLLSYHIRQAPISKQGRPVRSQVDVNFEGTVPKPSRGAERESRRGLTCRGPGSKRCVPSPPPTQRTEERGAGGTSSAHLGLCGSSGGKPRAGQTTVNHRPRRLFPHGHGCHPVSLLQPDGHHHAKPVRFQNRGEEGISRGDQTHGLQVPVFSIALAALSALGTHSPPSTNKLPPRKRRTPGKAGVCVAMTGTSFLQAHL